MNFPLKLSTLFITLLFTLFFSACRNDDEPSIENVPEVINGHKLPPELDETLNNSTLLGIDSNNNGVRDDVERYVIKRYAQDPEFPKTKTALAMQYAWAE